MRKHIETLLTRDVLTLGEAANELGLSLYTLQTMRRRGNLAAVKRGKAWLVDREDIEKRKRRS